MQGGVVCPLKLGEKGGPGSDRGNSPAESTLWMCCRRGMDGLGQTMLVLESTVVVLWISLTASVLSRSGAMLFTGGDSIPMPLNSGICIGGTTDCLSLISRAFPWPTTTHGAQKNGSLKSKVLSSSLK